MYFCIDFTTRAFASGEFVKSIKLIKIVMKKILTLSTMLLMFVAVLTTSCSSEKSALKTFKKTGYEMTELQPAQQVALSPLMASFPMYGQTALGYTVAANSITFVYEQDETAWNIYAQTLRKDGFSNVANGYVKADKSLGVTYNVSTNVATIYKRNYRLVTFACAEF